MRLLTNLTGNTQTELPSSTHHKSNFRLSIPVYHHDDTTTKFARYMSPSESYTVDEESIGAGERL